MASAIAAAVGLPDALLPALLEVYAEQGEVAAKSLARHPQMLAKVRSSAEVEARIFARPGLLEFLGDATEDVAKARQRLIFCGRYAAKEGTPLDSALDNAATGLRSGCELTAKVGGRCKLRVTVRPGIFGDEHLQCRGEAYPYRPACSASHGAPVIDARAADSSAVEAGSLLGYVAMQGDYADDIAVTATCQGQGIATALLAGAAAQVCAAGGRTMSLDVRAANTPALGMYQKLGFVFGQNEYPGFLDWDGGYSGVADAAAVRDQIPPNATLQL